jgi:hypothetical protein
MITVKVTITRPTEFIQWMQFPEVLVNHIKKTYVDTNKRVSHNVDNSNPLVMVTETVWDTRESYEEYLNDPYVRIFNFTRKQYYNSHSVVTTLEIIPDN